MDPSSQDFLERAKLFLESRGFRVFYSESINLNGLNTLIEVDGRRFNIIPLLLGVKSYEGCTRGEICLYPCSTYRDKIVLVSGSKSLTESVKLGVKLLLQGAKAVVIANTSALPPFGFMELPDTVLGNRGVLGAFLASRIPAGIGQRYSIDTVRICVGLDYSGLKLNIIAGLRYGFGEACILTCSPNLLYGSKDRELSACRKVALITIEGSITVRESLVVRTVMALLQYVMPAEYYYVLACSNVERLFEPCRLLLAHGLNCFSATTSPSRDIIAASYAAYRTRDPYVRGFVYRLARCASTRRYTGGVECGIHGRWLVLNTRAPPPRVELGLLPTALSLDNYTLFIPVDCGNGRAYASITKALEDLVSTCSTKFADET